MIAHARALSNRSARAAFLCYHSINDAGTSHEISSSRFECQLAALRAWGYISVTERTLGELAAGRRHHGHLVLLSFDDGFRDTYTHAFPLLKAYNFTALVFVLPPLVDQAGTFMWREVATEVERRPDVFRSMDWQEVGLMAEAGIEFGSHTCRHERLTDLDDDELRQELLDSRMRIKQRLGRCDSVAYPYGACDGRVVAAARSAGYSYGFSLPYGSPGVGWQPRYTRLSIPRIAMDDRDDERRLRLKLRPAGRRLLLSPAKSVLTAVERLR
jgi:peptidoglycan/xylan/chitin deacetylase (PgdA/CDA1 family)